ncbi:MAG: hypothetical protein QNK37_15355 [Acidobacteriota bacterium]|nr:hypothetical protein [Acidobacteriota bacterium]
MNVWRSDLAIISTYARMEHLKSKTEQGPLFPAESRPVLQALS